MKKLKEMSFALVFSCLALGSTLAQDPILSETVTITKVKKGEEPSAVMTALKKDFPNLVVQDISFLPRALYGKEWAVNLEDDTDDQPMDDEFYQVSAMGSNIKYTAVYDKTGKLLRSKETIKNAALPTTVTSAIASNYPGWRTIGDQERIKDAQGVSVTYLISLAKGKEKERVIMNANGKVLHEPRKLH